MKIKINTEKDTVVIDGVVYRKETQSTVQAEIVPEMWVFCKLNGKIYQVEKIDKQGWAVGNVDGHGWHVSHLRPATFEEYQQRFPDKKSLPKTIDDYRRFLDDFMGEQGCGVTASFMKDFLDQYDFEQ
jgi:hypothetical protein